MVRFAWVSLLEPRVRFSAMSARWISCYPERRD